MAVQTESEDFGSVSFCFCFCLVVQGLAFAKAHKGFVSSRSRFRTTNLGVWVWGVFTRYDWTIRRKKGDII